MNKTDKKVLELCKSWFEDISERSDKLTTGNVSHGSRAIHGVAMNYAEYVDEYLHNSSRGYKVAWSEEDELNLNQAIYVCYQHGYSGVEIWLKSFKERIRSTNL